MFTVRLSSSLVVVSRINTSTLRRYTYGSTQDVLSKRIVVLGAGTAGISVAAQLKEKGVKNLTIIAPNEFHDYQPGWTLVGASILTLESTRRKTETFIPSGATWLKDSVVQFQPEKNSLKLLSGKEVEYDHLVVAMGLKIDWDSIKGLKEHMGKNGVCSNYSYETVGYTRDFVNGFEGGNAIFSHPPTPVKCAGAPQKIMYLSEDVWRRKGIRDKVTVHFYTSLAVLFGVGYYAKALMEQCTSRNLHVHFRYNLIEIQPKQAIFVNLDTKEQIIQPYDFLHVTPPMGPSEVLIGSPIADANGWVEVNSKTLRHLKYGNVYALGDCAGLPTSKTAAAISSQAPVLVENLLAQADVRSYDGYTSCPIPVKRGGLILAEFDYSLTPKETFPFDQRKATLTAYLVKVFLFPFMYWHGTLTGRWKGPSSLKHLPFLCKPKKYE